HGRDPPDEGDGSEPEAAPPTRPPAPAASTRPADGGLMTAPALHFDLPRGIEPREYQDADGFRGRPVICAPTESGKTVMGCLLSASAVSRGSRVLWIDHRRELCLQAREKLEEFGLLVARRPRSRRR